MSELQGLSVYSGLFMYEQKRWLAYPHEGCGLAVFDTGAYCSSMASNYNMRVMISTVKYDAIFVCWLSCQNAT